MPVRVRPTAPLSTLNSQLSTLNSQLSTLNSVNPPLLPASIRQEVLMRRTLIAASAFLLAASFARAAYSPATTNGWLITAGRVAGVGGSLFRTDVWLFNPDDAASVTLTLVLHPAVTNGAPASASISSAPIVLAARETRFFPDVTL